MREEDIFLEKVILEINLGTHESTHRKKVIEHVSKILELKQSWTQSKCKNPVAKWGTRKNHILGIRITLRKKQAKRILEILKVGINVQKEPVRDQNLFQGGISSHRKLVREKFDYKAPNYGINYKLCFGFKGMRSWKRRIDPCLKRFPKIDPLQTKLKEFLL